MPEWPPCWFSYLDSVDVIGSNCPLLLCTCILQKISINPCRTFVIYAFMLLCAVPLSKPAYLALYFTNSSVATNPLKLLDLTTDFSDYSPFGGKYF